MQSPKKFAAPVLALAMAACDVPAPKNSADANDKAAIMQIVYHTLETKKQLTAALKAMDSETFERILNQCSEKTFPGTGERSSQNPWVQLNTTLKHNADYRKCDQLKNVSDEEECRYQTSGKILSKEARDFYYQEVIAGEMKLAACVDEKVVNELQNPRNVEEFDPTDPTLNLTYDSLLEFTKSGTVVVDFYADWCRPCQLTAPVLREMAKQFNGKVKFGRIDVENEPKASDLIREFDPETQKTGIKLPTVRIYKNGKLILSRPGYVSEDTFNEVFQPLLK